MSTCIAGQMAKAIIRKSFAIDRAGVVLAVVHEAFCKAGAPVLRRHNRGDAVICDLKSVFAPDDSSLRL